MQVDLLLRTTCKESCKVIRVNSEFVYMSAFFYLCVVGELHMESKLQQHRSMTGVISVT